MTHCHTRPPLPPCETLDLFEPPSSAALNSEQDEPPICAPSIPDEEAGGDIPVLMYLPPHLLEQSTDDPHPMVRDAAHHALVDRLHAHGQDHVVSAYAADDGHYTIRSGARVWYAAREAGLSELRVEVHPPTSRVEAMRVIAREDRDERPRGSYERAQLAGRMRAVLGEALGRAPTIREVAPELGISDGATCERLRIHDRITAEVVERAGISPEEMVAASHTGLHQAATKSTVPARAAWLHYAARRRFPPGWEEETRPRALVLRRREDGSVHVESPAPAALDPADARRALEILEPFVFELSRRAEGEGADRAAAEAA